MDSFYTLPRVWLRLRRVIPRWPYRCMILGAGSWLVLCWSLGHPSHVWEYAFLMVAACVYAPVVLMGAWHLQGPAMLLVACWTLILLGLAMQLTVRTTRWKFATPTRVSRRRWQHGVIPHF